MLHLETRSGRAEKGLHVQGQGDQPRGEAKIGSMKKVVKLADDAVVDDRCCLVAANHSLCIHSILVHLFVFKSIGAIVIYYGFASGKNFNEAISIANHSIDSGKAYEVLKSISE